MDKVKCETCKGTGQREVSFATCCNRPLRSGGCCDNPIEDRRLEPCDDCGGTGFYNEGHPSAVRCPV